MEFLLVHGSTQSPRAYERLAGALTARGHRSLAVDLPVDRPQWSADDYAEHVRTELSEPVLVVHSAAGAIAPALARATGARHVVWLAALLPDPGRSILDEARTDPGMFGDEWKTWDAPLENAAETAYFLFHDCDLDTLRWALTTTRLWQPRAVLEQTAAEIPLPPSTYVLPVEDRTLTPAWMRKAATQRLGIEAVEVEGGHCPHVSRPDEIAALLDR